MSAERIPYISPEEYLAIERVAETKSEYLDGQMFAMAGASFRHNRIIVNLATGLNSALRGGPCQVVVQDLRVRVSPEGLYTYPDVVTVCGEPEFADSHEDTLTNPTLLVEVLSPSTEAYDRGAKFQHYRTLSTLKQYVLVAQEEPLVEVYTRQEGGGWLLREFRGQEATAELTAVNCHLPLVEIYRDLTFAA